MGGLKLQGPLYLLEQLAWNFRNFFVPPNAEHFSDEAKLQRWDRIHIVCSQPFAKGSQFGLSVLRVVEDVVPAENPSPALPVSPPPSSKRTTTVDRSPPNRPSANKFSAPSWKSSIDIQKHFFGNNKQ